MTMAAVIVSVLLTLSKFAGMAKEILLTRYFGATAATDAFKVVYNSFVFLIYTKIEKLERPCYLPLFVYRKDEDGEERAWQFAAVVMAIHFLALVAISALAVVFAPWIISTFWPGLQDEGFRLAVLLMRLMAPALLAFSLSVMPELTLHSYKQFTIPALAEAAFRIIAVITLAVLAAAVWKPGEARGILAAGIGVVLGGTARLVVQLPAFKRHWQVASMARVFRQVWAEMRAIPWWVLRWPHKPFVWGGGLVLSVVLTIGLAKMNWVMVGYGLLIGVALAAIAAALFRVSKIVAHPSGDTWVQRQAEAVDGDRNREMLRTLIPPIVVGLTYSALRTYIDSYCGTHIEEGAYSCLDYARRLPDTAAQILPLAVSFVVYPFLSEWAHRGEKDRLADALVQTTRVIAFIFIPATVWMMILRWGVLWVVYGGGEFTPDKQQLSAWALLAYAPGMVFFCIEGILNKWYFALSDTKTPNYVGSACAILHVIIAVMGTFTLALGDRAIIAVALALTISKSVKVVILYAMLRARLGAIERRAILVFALKLAVASAIMAAAIHFASGAVLRYIELESRKSGLIYLAVTSAVAVPAFLVPAIVLRVEETWIVLDQVKKRLLRKRS
jgi:peptidoglycan biosynthesis protein MviN/MurJ (putative lipid II flippase)